MNWNLPKQTIFSNQDDPLQPPGDCWRCCIAALLQVPAATVPHFVAESLSCEAAAQRWLNQRGYALITLNAPFGSRGSLYLTSFGDDPDPCIPWIAIGPTVRSRRPGQSHAVVMLAGRMVYDPHPSEAGLLAVAYGELVMRTFP